MYSYSSINSCVKINIKFLKIYFNNKYADIYQLLKISTYFYYSYRCEHPWPDRVSVLQLANGLHLEEEFNFYSR